MKKNKLERDADILMILSALTLFLFLFVKNGTYEVTQIGICATIFMLWAYYKKGLL